MQETHPRRSLTARCLSISAVRHARGRRALLRICQSGQPGSPSTAQAPAAPVDRAALLEKEKRRATPDADGDLKFVPPSSFDANWTNIKLAFALPWRRFKSGSVLTFK